jgi:hypothetical protein
MARAKKDQAAQPEAAQTELPGIGPVTAPEGYLTVKKAAARIGVDVQKLRNAINNRKEFKTAGAVAYVPVEDYDIPPLIYVKPEAVDLYAANNASGNVASVGRLKDGRKRWIIRIKPEDEGAVRELLASFGTDLEVASAPHKKKDVASAEDTSAPEPATGDTTKLDGAAALGLSTVEQDEAADEAPVSSDQAPY